LILYAEAQAQELAIIANKAYPATRITMDTLTDIYLGEKTTETSVRILPVDQEDPSIKKKFVEKILRTTIGRYDADWFKKAYTDGIVPPVMRELSKDVILFVEREVGAIGYVWGTEAQGISGIKVLLTIEVGE
jgi:ABC-type phosphate transport system substrate-binding protein